MTIDFREQAGGNVRPFRYFTQTVLPAVYDDSLSYMELVAKTIEYLNEVIESLNANNAAVTEMQGLLEQYKQYMDDYFENLDVQEEIDNKLDAMVANGTMTTLLQPIIAQVAPSTIETWLDEHPEATTTVQDGSITNAKLAQTGGVLSEVEDIRTAYDGTVYNSAGNAVRNQAKPLGDNYKPKGTPMELNWTRGKILQSSGNVADFSGKAYAVSDLMPVSPGEKYFATLRMNYNNSVYSIYDANNEKIDGKTVSGSAFVKKTYEIEIPQNGASIRFGTATNYISPDTVCTFEGYSLIADGYATDIALADSELMYDGMINGRIELPVATDYIWTTSGEKNYIMGNYKSTENPIRIAQGYKYAIEGYPQNSYSIWIEFDQSMTFLRNRESTTSSTYTPSEDAYYVTFTGYSDYIGTSTILLFEKIPVVETFTAEILDGSWYTTTGTLSTQSGYVGTDKTKIIPGKTYHIQEEPTVLTGNTFYICEFSKTGAFLRMHYISNACRFSVGSDTHYVSITWPANTKFIDLETLTLEYAKVGSGKWLGKKWLVVGDSLTENNQRTEMHYFDYIAEHTGITVINGGSSGTGYKKLYENNRAFYQRIPNMDANVDVITIFGSFNDASYFGEIGTPTDTTDETLCGCFNLAFDAIIALNPAIPFGVVAPTPWNVIDDTSGYGQYVAALEACCKRRGIPFLDLYHNSGLRPWDSDFKQIAYAHDNGGGTHPSKLGHALLAPHFEQFVDSLIMFDYN